MARTLTKPGPKPRPLAERIMAHVEFEPNTGCWLWTGTHDRAGYGRVLRGVKGKDRRMASAHRSAWLAFRGFDAAEMDVCHRCDTPPCVNPDHLFLGTARDNVHDSIRKGRFLRWRKVRVSDLGAAAIRLLVEWGALPQTKIAEAFGVSRSQINRIVRGRTHLPGSAQ
jgi:hypothetical protein